MAPPLVRFRAMAAVADLERLLERVFERTTARLFRSGVQVVQLERRVERAMERARTADGARIAVPARYRVRLHPSDLADVAARAGGAEAVALRLAQNALAFARSHGYHLAGRPEIWLVSDPVVDRGQVEVDIVRMGSPSASVQFDPSPSASATASAPEPPAAAPTSGPLAPAPVPAIVPARAPVPAIVPAPAVPAAPLAVEPPWPVIPPDLGSAAVGIRGDGTHTLVFRRPSPQPVRAILRVFGPGGQERTIEVDGIPLTIGRSTDNVLVLVDGRVSRRHGRLQARRGTLVYTDLGSTNGSRVNGIRVDEIVLGEGDRLQIGDTVMVVESLPD